MKFTVKKALVVIAASGLTLEAHSRALVSSEPSGSKLNRRWDIPTPDVHPDIPAPVIPHPMVVPDVHPDIPVPDKPAPAPEPASGPAPAPAPEPAPAPAPEPNPAPPTKPAPDTPDPVTPQGPPGPCNKGLVRRAGGCTDPGIGPSTGGTGPDPSLPQTDESYTGLQAAGDKVTGGLDAAIAGKTADKVVPQEKTIDNKQLYKVTADGNNRITRDIGQWAPDSKSTTYTEYRVMSATGKVDPFNPILSMSASSDQKTIVIESTFKKFDNNAVGDQIPSSDMIYQGWQKTGGTEVDRLISHNIQNPATRDAITSALSDAGKMTKAKNAQTTVLPGSAGYKAIVGSDNGRPFARMLTDYHNSFRDKKIVSIDIDARSIWSIKFNIG